MTRLGLYNSAIVKVVLNLRDWLGKVPRSAKCSLEESSFYNVIPAYLVLVMSKKNKSRPFYLSYIDVSPSKRRSLHKKTIRPTLAAHSATVSSSKSGERNTLDAVADSGPERSLADTACPGAGVDVLCDDDGLHFSSQNIDIDSDDLSGCAYSKRQQKAANNWSEVRDQLLHATVESSVPSGVLVHC